MLHYATHYAVATPSAPLPAGSAAGSEEEEEEEEAAAADGVAYEEGIRMLAGGGLEFSKAAAMATYRYRLWLNQVGDTSDHRERRIRPQAAALLSCPQAGAAQRKRFVHPNP